MNLCSGGRGEKAHEEIVYDSRSCPFCEYVDTSMDEIKDLKSQIEKMEESE
jgi:hypothetical protein